MEHLLAALFAFFQERPDAYRFLFRDVWAAREESIEASAVVAGAPLVAEIASLLAGTEEAREEVDLASRGILGFALSAIELALTGQVEAETAWRWSRPATPRRSWPADRSVASPSVELRS